MPESPAERHRRISGAFTALVSSTVDWDAPTPVGGWTARDVVEHLVGWLPPFLASGAGLELPGHRPGAAGDPTEAWRRHDEAVQALLEDPDRAERTLSNPHVGDLPVGRAIDQFYVSDVFLHRWDLARSNDLSPGLDEAECAAMLAGMEPLDDLLRTSGQYGPRVPVSDDASASDRLIGFIGRDPAWRP